MADQIRALNDIVVRDGGFLVVTKDREITTFMVFDFARDAYRFATSGPTRSASYCDYWEDTNTVAFLGWDDGDITLFNATDGLKRVTFFVPEAVCVKLLRDRIRVIGDDVYEYNYSGLKFGETPLRGTLVRDLGQYLLVGREQRHRRNRLCLMMPSGEVVTEFEESGLGVTSAAAEGDWIAVSESRGPTSVFAHDGKLLWRAESPEGHHPILVGITPDGNTFTIHGPLASLPTSILTVHDIGGHLKCQSPNDSRPIDAGFLGRLPGWLCSNLELLQITDGKLSRRVVAGGIPMINRAREKARAEFRDSGA